MNKITESDIKHISSLSNLPLKKEEIKKYALQLSEILGHIEKLNELDLKDTPETSQTTGLQNITRPDSISSQKILSSKDALSQASETHNNYFLIAALLDRDNE